MKSILSIISPITLCINHNPNTAKTGQGCLMDICSYLNGDALITDSSPCVMDLIRPLAMALNDRQSTPKRNELIRFIPRLMASGQASAEERAHVSYSLSLIRPYINSMVTSARGAIGSSIAPQHYDAYLLSLHLAHTLKSADDLRWAHFTAVQLSRATGYLQHAQLDCMARGATETFVYLERMEQMLMKRAVEYFDAMLPPLLVTETPTHHGRAQQLVDTRQAVWPV